MGGTEKNRANGLEAGDSEFLSALPLASNAGNQAKSRRRQDTWLSLT